ncbi:MAG: hypothetical protein V4736_14625, partial [Bdellovibrionota bacterium]
MSQIKLHPSWKSRLDSASGNESDSEFKKDYMLKLKAFLKSEYDKKKIIYPKPSEYFAALNLTP